MKTVQDAIKFIKEYNGFKEFKAIGLLLIAIYQAVKGGAE